MEAEIHGDDEIHGYVDPEKWVRADHPPADASRDPECAAVAWLGGHLFKNMVRQSVPSETLLL
jgi:hypothetical protein